MTRSQLLQFAIGNDRFDQPLSIADGLRADFAPGMHPAVSELLQTFLGSPNLKMLIDRAVSQADHPTTYNDYRSFCEDLNEVIQLAPGWHAEASFTGAGINALFKPIITTEAGRQLFRYTDFNRSMRLVMEAYYQFLDSKASTANMTDRHENAWFCAEARETIGLEEYEHDPRQPHYGFHSWNEFFTRKFRSGSRPIAGERDETILVAPCEAKVHRIAHDLPLEERFWIKQLPYSLRDVFGTHTAYSERYSGGTLVQGFLESNYYHRWHAPLSGVVRNVQRLDGSYYAAIDHAGEEGLKQSLPYLAHTAARAFVVLETEPYGLVTCLFIGMAEISTNVVTVRIGQQVQKGEEIGFFQYGGSSYCLFFESDCQIQFAVSAHEQLEDAPRVKLHTKLGELVSTR